MNITPTLDDKVHIIQNAIDLQAAKIKKIDSPVAGQADMLVVPDLEAGSMLAKSLSSMFALPCELHEAGVRRYGFHGLSYEYIASVLPQTDPKAAAGRPVVLHLGNGASMCGRSRGTRGTYSDEVSCMGRLNASA